MNITEIESWQISIIFSAIGGLLWMLASRVYKKLSPFWQGMIDKIKIELGGAVIVMLVTLAVVYLTLSLIKG